LEEDWCLFWGAIIVSIFHSRKETKNKPKKKKNRKNRKEKNEPQKKD
jgi:hypothetical protein